jgi:septum formation protein
MLKIVLASQSPRRKKLLNQLGLIFEISPSDKEEIITSDIPSEIVESLSFQKAEDVAPKFNEALIIGADTIVVQDNKVLGKPENEEEAVETLHHLSGEMHSVFTGISLLTVQNGEVQTRHSFFEETKVWFSTLSDQEIRSYVASGSPMDKAGAYGIQDDWGSVFVERIEGDYYNVVGFPLNRFYRELKNLQPSITTSVNIPVYRS